MSFKIVFARASSTPLRSFSALSSRDSSCSGDMSCDIDTDIGGSSCRSSTGSVKSGADAERGCGVWGGWGGVSAGVGEEACWWRGGGGGGGAGGGSGEKWGFFLKNASTGGS